jgi:hypothetical protein
MQGPCRGTDKSSHFRIEGWVERERNPPHLMRYLQMTGFAALYLSYELAQEA